MKDLKTKQSKKEMWAVVIFAQNRWGKGANLSEAKENCVGLKASEPLVIVSVFMPVGTDYYPQDGDKNPYESLGVDGMGSLHHPPQAKIFWMNEEETTVKLTITKR